MPINLGNIGRTVERYMLSSCRITRKTGETFNEITMKVTDVTQFVYEGRCYIVPMGDPASANYGGQPTYRTQFELAIPASSPTVLPNDLVEIISAVDPDLVDDGYFVHDQIVSTFFTHRRVKLFRDNPAT